MLHAVLTPTNSAKNTETKKIWKFSITDSRKGLIEKASCYTEISKLHKERKDIYKLHNISFQPAIFVIENENERNSYYTIYDNIIYKFNSIVHALSTCFKTIFVLNLEYQLECKQIWEFIQIYFFEIELKTISSSLSSLLSNLNNNIS